MCKQCSKYKNFIWWLTQWIKICTTFTGGVGYKHIEKRLIKLRDELND